MWIEVLQSPDTNLLVLKGFNMYSSGIENGIEWILHISLLPYTSLGGYMVLTM